MRLMDVEHRESPEDRGMSLPARTVGSGRGGVERRGVDRIPDGERTSTPWTFFVIFVGTSVGLGAVAFGWVGIAFGLGLWATVSAIAAGTVVGQILLIPLILIGSRTATNNATASGAAFGVRGRVIGSGIGLATCLVSVALTVWTSGSAGLSVAARLFGVADSQAAQAWAYALVTAIAVVVAIWGYRWLVRSTAILALIGGVLLVLMPFAFAADIEWDYAGGQYLLGGFWPTWLSVAATVGVGGALVVCTILGDWTRYIRSDRHPARKLAPVASAGIFVGFVVPATVGAVVSTALTDPFAPFTVSLAAESPLWYAVVLLPLAVLGGVGLTASSLYSAGLDLDALVVRITRSRATVIVGAVAVALVYFGLLAPTVQASISAALLLLAELSAPWAVVVGIGFLQVMGRYHADDLQVFNRGRTGGRYWFTGGWRLPAVLAWAGGSVVGLLTVQTPLFAGPLAGVANGVDVSLLAASAVAGLAYVLLTVRAADA
jgi:purine-cytosine permease-like protein